LGDDYSRRGSCAVWTGAMLNFALTAF
jgi:hypothetical protein